MAVDGGLRGIFRAHLPDFDWQTIEVGTIGRGVPDANYCCGGVEGWVECKATRGWDVDLRKEQVAWIGRRCRHGGRVVVAVRQRIGREDVLWVLAGQFASHWRACGLPRNWPHHGLLGHPWSGGPARWNWAAVRAALGVRETGVPQG